MTRKEISEYLVSNQGLDPASATNAVNGVFNCISNAIKSGDQIILRDFGSFVVKLRQPRVVRDFKRNRQKTVPEKKVVKFTASKSLVEKLNF